MALLFPKYEDVVEAAGFPTEQAPLPAEGDDAMNPCGLRISLDAGRVDVPSRAERVTSSSATAARLESPSWPAASPTLP